MIRTISRSKSTVVVRVSCDRIVRGTHTAYGERHPGPEDVALLVEVADSSLQYDRGTKKRVYARANVQVYWIVNLIDRQIEVYTEPTGPADQPDYLQHHDYREDDTIPVVLDGQEIGQLAVRELLP